MKFANLLTSRRVCGDGPVCCFLLAISASMRCSIASSAVEDGGDAVQAGSTASI